MKPLLVLILSLSLSIAAFGQTQPENAQMIHALLIGSWIDTIESTKYDVMNFDTSTIADYLVITDGPDKNDGPTMEPGSVNFKYEVTRKSCIPDSLEPMKNGTGYYLRLTSRPFVSGRIDIVCYYIGVINDSCLILYNGRASKATVYKKRKY